MRHFQIILVIQMFILSGFTNANEVGEKITILKNAEIVVSVNNEEGFNFFKEATYEAERGDIKFLTSKKIDKITVFKEEEKLVYVMPVKTKKIIIGKSLFEKGDYELIFQVAFEDKTYSTQLEVL